MSRRLKSHRGKIVMAGERYVYSMLLSRYRSSFCFLALNRASDSVDTGSVAKKLSQSVGSVCVVMTVQTEKLLDFQYFGNVGQITVPFFLSGHWKKHFLGTFVSLKVEFAKLIKTLKFTFIFNHPAHKFDFYTVKDNHHKE